MKSESLGQVYHTPLVRALLVAKDIKFLYGKGRFYCMDVHGFGTKTKIPNEIKVVFLVQGSFPAVFLFA